LRQQRSITNDREGVVTDVAVGPQIVGPDQISRIDLVALHELVATPRHAADDALFRLGRGMTNDGSTEIRCDACGGSGSLPVRQLGPGRRIYPGRCTKLVGRGVVGSALRTHL
jgi:hypothetical protein